MPFQGKAPQPRFQLNARIPSELAVRLWDWIKEEKAAGRDVSQNAAVERALDAWLAVHKQESEIRHAQPD